MNAMPAEKLRDPEQLYAPPTSKKREDVVKSLTPEGGREFARQVMEAMVRSREEGDLRPLNMVIESWYRTLQFYSRPDFEKKWTEAQEEQSSWPRFSLKDIQVRRAHRDR